MLFLLWLLLPVNSSEIVTVSHGGVNRRCFSTGSTASTGGRGETKTGEG